MSDLLKENSLLAPFYVGQGIDDDTWYNQVFPNAKKPVWMKQPAEPEQKFDDGLDKKITKRMTDGGN